MQMKKIYYNIKYTFQTLLKSSEQSVRKLDKAIAQINTIERKR